MEESSNGKLEQIQKVESQEEDKKIVVEELGEVQGDAESVREIVDNRNPESANVDRDDPQVVDSRELEEEKTIIDSVVDPNEPEASLAKELTEDAEVAVEMSEAHGDIAESESKETEVRISQSLEESNCVSADETNDLSKATEEETLPSDDEKNEVSQAVTETIGEIILPSSEENSEAPPVITDIVSKGIEETKLPVLEQHTEESSKGKVDELNQAMANSGTVDDTCNPPKLANEPETIPGSTGNPGNFRPTSWRSCCGLLDILRRSDR